MYSCWRKFAISQDEMEMVVAAAKESREILIYLNHRPRTTFTMTEILNEKSYQDLNDFSIRDRIEQVIESNKVLTKMSLAHNVLDRESNIYHYVGSFKLLFDRIINQGLPYPWYGNGDL